MIMYYYFSLQKISDEYLEKKIEYAREVALSAQQNEFLTKKIEDLQKQNDNVFIHYEEKLSKLILFLL